MAANMALKEDKGYFGGTQVSHEASLIHFASQNEIEDDLDMFVVFTL